MPHLRNALFATFGTCLVEATLAACGSDAPVRPTSDAATDVGDADGERPDGSLVDATPPGERDAGSSDAAPPGDASHEEDASLPADAEAGTAPCETLTLGSLRTSFPRGGDTTGATVAYDGCAKTSAAAGGANGAWSLRISAAPSFYRVSRAGSRTTLSGETPANVGAGATVGLQLVGTAAPGYDPTKAHVALTLGVPTGGCTTNGNTVSLVGHPEAVVRYVDTNGDDVGAATNVDGLVWITNVDPSAGAFATVAISPAVPGCSLRSAAGPATGRLPLVADTVTAVTRDIGK